MRTTKAELYELAAVINRITDGDYHIQYAYGRPRLFRAGGSIEVSPRLPAGEMKQWLHAFIAGLVAR